ncbi:MAG: transcription-repair coupling factor, partial [Planctomycetaceae bacterium]|nr:transcription-repair coupling factor [Planctomycetaceae bacterium]
MTAADTPQPVERGELGTLAARLTTQPDFQAVARALTAAQLTSIDGAWGSAAAMVVAALSAVAPSTVLVILPREKELDAWALDVQTFAGVTPLLFPAWEMLPEELRMSDPILGSRLRVLKALEGATPPRIVIATMQALLQPVPSRSRREEATQRWRVGDTLDLDAISTWLQDRGFERVPAVEMPGEFSLRGGILDLFSPDASDPVRIELFGDEIDSLRTFSVETQQKLEELREITLTLISPLKEAGETTDTLRTEGENLLASLPTGAWVVLQELDDLQAEGKLYLQRLDDRRGLFSVEATFAHCQRFGSVQLAGLVANGYETTCHLKTQSIELFVRPKSEALAELAEAAGRDESILIACHNEAARLRLAELLAESAPDLVNRVQLGLGHVSRGFRLIAIDDDTTSPARQQGVPV